MDSIITVLMLGLSADGIIVCPFFVMGLSLSDRLAGLRFLSGRIAGLVCFGGVISLLGRSVLIKDYYIDIAFSLTIILLGVYRIVKSGRKIEFLEKKRSFLNLTGKCNGRGNMKTAGFFLGFFRGLLNPGRKYVYLAPLLLGVGFFRGIALSFTFGISSSVYLIIGLLSAGIISRLNRHKMLIGISGGIILVITGLYYGCKGINGLINIS